MIKYIRLLSYENACAVVDLINDNSKDNNGHITTGGVAMQVTDKKLQEVESFLKGINVRYEISATHPEVVNYNITKTLIAKGVIEGNK